MQGRANLAVWFNIIQLGTGKTGRICPWKDMSMCVYPASTKTTSLVWWMSNRQHTQSIWLTDILLLWNKSQQSQKRDSVWSSLVNLPSAVFSLPRLTTLTVWECHREHFFCSGDSMRLHLWMQSVTSPNQHQKGCFCTHCRHTHRQEHDQIQNQRPNTYNHKSYVYICLC